jgi:hypothetical protein
MDRADFLEIFTAADGLSCWTEGVSYEKPH